MYRNIAYISDERVMRLFTWDEAGNRVSYDVPYRPYFYTETKHGNYDKMSLYNTKLAKVEFPNEYRRRDAISRLKAQERDKNPANPAPARIFEGVSTLQQFLIDRYWQENSTQEFSRYPIKIQFLDIETYSPDAFPVPDKANDVVNVITVYDSLSKKFNTWGLNPYKPSRDDVVYKHCQSERDLLVSFVEFISSDYPDILSGWNSEFFDIPYLVNRIQKILGEEFSKRLSPVRTVYSRQLISKFGKYNTRWHFKGVSCVDYLDVYKKFSSGLRESYKLDDVGEFELGDKKVDYGNQNLASLADSDWKTFVDYNIQDVNLLVKLEEKLQYVQLLRMLAYIGLTPFENAMGSLNVITGAGVIQARKNDRVVPTFAVERSQERYEGAYVGSLTEDFKIT